MAKDPNELWKVSLAQIEVRLDNPAQFKTFFQPARMIEFSQGKATVGFPSGYVLDWVKQKHYDQLLIDTLSHVHGKDVKVDFVVAGSEDKDKIKSSFYESPLLSIQNGIHSSLLDLLRKAGLNEKYSMSNFVLGDSNRIAHAAAAAVMDRPGQSYNPLFIYGHTGVGKTHLAQAIGRSVIERNPGNKVQYITAENFLNEMVSGIRGFTMAKFRAKFRDVKVLILDDIQLISKWVKTQDEFFNTFNELQNSGNQIVLIADRAPEDIQNLEDRLKSRFRGGLVADIGQPDYELRLAIVKQKAQELAIYLSDRILDVIARGVSDNVRELEGALQKVALFNQMKPGNELTTEEVERIIGIDTNSRREKIRVPAILKKIGQEFGVTVKDLKQGGRTQDVAFARQVAMYVLREEFGYKLEEVAGFLGRKDHTTVLHGVDKIKARIMTTDPFKQQIVALIRDLQESPLAI
jgi:chromosomal replication initiator protein